MPKKRFSAEQIVTLLRQIEVSMAQGKSTPDACRAAEISHRVITAGCHAVCGLGLRLRKSAAIIGPKWFTQRRTDSYETVMPRSASRSSTSRKLSVNRR